MDAKHCWSVWQDLLLCFACCFTTKGWRRFVEWVTGLVLNVEEHTITQSLVALERPNDWKALETFAEVGHWNRLSLERALALQLEQAPGRLWYGYHVEAGDDTKVHRNSPNVWGTCTFHEYTARCPNRASTVRAHNWVVVGALLQNPEQPAWFLPQTARLYCRRAQLPVANGAPMPFRTKNELLVEQLREEARTVGGKHLAVFDGAYAVRNVVRVLVLPSAGLPRVDILTRSRRDSRLSQLPPQERRAGQRGPLPRWGKQLPPPRQGGRWPGQWQTGTAFIYGRQRQVHWKEILCLWRVLGWEVVVKAVVAAVDGYSQRFTLVTTATDLSGLQMVELFTARYRQEDGFRDLKQRLGWEECRAWTQAPIERTTQALLVTMSLLRMLQFRLQEEIGDGWWLHPPWNPRKQRPSVLDVERLLRRHAAEIRRFLSAWLGSEVENTV
jgi:hypothetical protein